MGRLKIEDKEELDKQIENGLITCKTCKVRRELGYFGRQKYTNADGSITWSYKVKKCKCCTSPRGELVRPHSYTTKSILRAPKKVKLESSVMLSKECKKFLQRLIYMRGYIDQIEAFQLVDHHINTFGYVERLIINTEEELSVMFEELLSIYYKEQSKI